LQLLARLVELIDHVTKARRNVKISIWTPVAINTRAISRIIVQYILVVSSVSDRTFDTGRQL
jgi:hypothetical protein